MLFQGGFLFQEIQSHVPQHSHIFRSVIFSDTAFVLPKGDIRHPVQVVFDIPMAADSVGKLLDAHIQAADIITDFTGYGIADMAFSGQRESNDRIDSGDVYPSICFKFSFYYPEKYKLRIKTEWK